MRWFENLNISIKLVTCLLIITCFTVVVGIVGLLGMRQIDRAVDYVVDQSRSIFYLSRAKETLQGARISVRDMVLGAIADDRDQIEAAFANIALDMEEIEARFNSFDSINKSEDIQNAFESGRLLYKNELVPIIQGIYQASIIGDLSNVFALLEECVAVSNDILVFFDNSMQMGLRDSGVVTADAHNLMTRSSLLITVTLSASILLSLLLAFYLASMLTRNIKALMVLAEQISGGNLHPVFPSVPNDEIGMLAQSFGTMSKEVFSVLEAIQMKSKTISGGNLQAVSTGYIAKGDFQQIIDDVSNIEWSIFQYLNGLRCTIIIFDTKYRFTFINTFAQNQGYDPAVLKGKTILEALPVNEAEAISANLEKVRATGETLSYQIEMVSPKGELIVAEQTIAPICGKNGKIITFMIVGYDITNLVKAQKLSEKVSAYQDFESSDLSNKLKTGLSQGILQFEFELEPSDDDTAAAAATYGLISDTIKHSLAFIKSYVNEITKLLSQIANKDFDLEIEREYIGDFGSIKDSIITMTDSISAFIVKVQGTADGIETGAMRIAASMQEFIASFDSQKEIMDSMKDATVRLNEKTQRNVKDTEDARSLSGKMQVAAQDGNKQMQNLSNTMDEINKVSSETAKIAKVVEDIAFQTNLLALNAAIEAANAGEHGKGFGVVAEEVRNLAIRSAKAAKEASDLLEESSSRIRTGQTMTLKTSEALSNIVEITANVAGLISKIAAASDEQAKDIDGIRNDAEEIYQSIAEDTNTAQENAVEIEELSAYTSVLNDLLKQFHTKKSLEKR